MDQARFERLDALFNAALELPEDERPAYLDQTCDGDEDLRSKLVRMLAAQADESFLARPVGRAAVEAAPVEVRADEPLGRVGRIRIVEHLGSGGMGKVYRGVDETLRRPVAVKILRYRLPKGSPRRARLLWEAQVVSQLGHPGICQVYDFIEGEEFDYLVLELIEGETLKEVLARQLSLAEALQIAQQIADALAAAHSRGVVHRDLKPSNVMLTAGGRSGRPRVKVLDFGIARIAEPGHSEGDDFNPVSTSPEASTGPLTLTGLALGTPRYMSPEQAAGTRATPASDMFAFGLLLQEMVTGRPAFDRELSPDVLMSKVRAAEIEPRRGLPRELDELCARLQSESPAVRPVAADTAERLRWIEREPRRRARRIAYTGLTLALLILAGGMSFLASRLRDEVERANHEAATARQVSDFLVELFEVSDPWQTEASTVTARELLDRGARKIRDELVDQPRTRARLLDTMGNVYRGLGFLDEATPLLEEGLELRRQHDGPVSVDVAASLSHLGLLYTDKGEYESAEAAYRQAVELQRNLLGPDHPDRAKTLHDFGLLEYHRGNYDHAEVLQKEALAIRLEINEVSKDVAESLSDLAVIHSVRGDFDRAEELHRRALEIRRAVLPPNHPELATSYAILAFLHFQQGRYAEAEPLFLSALEIAEKALGPDHPTVAMSLSNLAALYQVQGEFQRSEPYALRSMQIRESVLGPDHPDLAASLNNLAVLYEKLGDFKRAEELHLRTLKIWRKTLGSDHPNLARSLANLAKVYRKQGDRARAEPLFREALAIRERVLEPGHPDLVDNLNGLAGLYLDQGNGDLAEPLYRRVLALTETLLADDPEKPQARGLRATALIGLGKLHEVRGEEQQSRESWRAAVALLEPLNSTSEVSDFLDSQAVALLLLGRVEEARPLVDKLLARGWKDPELLELCRRYRLLSSPSS